MPAIKTMIENTRTILNCSFIECSQFLEASKVNLNEVFQQLSIDYQTYKQAPFILNEAQIGLIIQSIYSQANLPHLGLLIGKRIRFGFTSNNMMSANGQLNLKECLWALSRYLYAFFPGLVIEYFERETMVGYRLIRYPCLASHPRFYTEAIAAMINQFLTFMGGENTHPEYISFDFSQPEYIDDYKEHFRCKLNFDCDQFEIAVSRTIADSAVTLGRSSFAPFSQYNSVGLLFPLQLYPLCRSIRSMIEQNVDEFPSSTFIADNLRISARTLHRKLSKFDSTFQKELDFFRREQAFKYLSSSENDVTGVAFMLGFCDASAFSKAFKRWSGFSPREFKKRCRTN